MGAKHTRMAPFEFPLHTSVAAYLVDLALTVLVFLCAMTGLEAHPNLSHPPAQRKVMAILGGGLLGWYCFVHLFTPAGLLPGFTSIFICSILPWLAGSIPLLVFPIYRDVVHAVPQTWLTGLHSLRVAGFLYLTLFDIKLLPGGFAVPAGWGGLLVGGLAPVVAHAFGTSSRHAREMGIGFNILGLVEILIELICGFMLLGPFMQHRVDHRLTVRCWGRVTRAMSGCARRYGCRGSSLGLVQSELCCDYLELPGLRISQGGSSCAWAEGTGNHQPHALIISGL